MEILVTGKNDLQCNSNGNNWVCFHARFVYIILSKHLCSNNLCNVTQTVARHDETDIWLYQTIYAINQTNLNMQRNSGKYSESKMNYLWKCEPQIAFQIHAIEGVLSILPEFELIFDTHSSSNCSSFGCCVDVLHSIFMLPSSNSAVSILFRKIRREQTTIVDVKWCCQNLVQQ